MRLKIIALGCALTGSFGFFALPQASARADSMMQAAAAKATLTLHGPDTAQTPVTVARTRVGRAHHNSKAVLKGDGAAPSARAKVQRPIKRKTQMSVSASVTDNPYGATVTITVTLRPVGTHGTVTLYATPLGQARELVATGKVDADGKWYPTYSITRETTFTAVFDGNRHSTANSASRTLYAFARVANRFTGYYTTSKSRDGHTYGIFHTAGTLTLYSTVTPNKHGECLEPETQQQDKGHWDADTKYGCDALDSASHDTAPFSLSQATGARYRIRGDYLRSTTDTANLNAQGPWLYFIVMN